MTSDPSAPQFKPGDRANGHVLGHDGVWRPLPVLPPESGPGYWRRFGNRFPWCVLIVGVLAFVGFMASRSGTDSIAYLLGKAIGSGLIYGAVLGLLVAIIPGRK